MLDKNTIAIKGIVKTAELFGEDYVREHYPKLEVESISEPIDGEYQYFVAFAGDKEKNLWTVFSLVGVNETTGDKRMLDYRLPNGERMKNPIVPVRLAAS